MRTRLLLVGIAGAWLLAGDRWEPAITADSLPLALVGAREPTICLMPDRNEYDQTRGGGAGHDIGGERRMTGEWAPAGVHGGDVMPARTVFDPYPTFDGVAVDPAIGRTFFTDSSLSSVLSYETTAGSSSRDITEHETRVMGPDTGIGFVAGMDVDPERKEVYAINNDGGGIVVFGYDQNGPVRPVRQLETPHQSWDVSVSALRNEVAVSVQQLSGIVIYRRGASDMQPPLRSIRGYATGLADPHGLDFDDSRNELVVANHGNWDRAAALQSVRSAVAEASVVPARPLRATVDQGLRGLGGRRRQGGAQYRRPSHWFELADGPRGRRRAR
jgi:hypothetical protein